MGEMSEYELYIIRNIEENKKHMRELGLESDQPLRSTERGGSSSKRRRTRPDRISSITPEPPLTRARGVEAARVEAEKVEAAREVEAARAREVEAARFRASAEEAEAAADLPSSFNAYPTYNSSDTREAEFEYIQDVLLYLDLKLPSDAVAAVEAALLLPNNTYVENFNKVKDSLPNEIMRKIIELYVSKNQLTGTDLELNVNLEEAVALLYLAKNTDALIVMNGIMERFPQYYALLLPLMYRRETTFEDHISRIQERGILTQARFPRYWLQAIAALDTGDKKKYHMKAIFALSTQRRVEFFEWGRGFAAHSPVQGAAHGLMVKLRENLISAELLEHCHTSRHALYDVAKDALYMIASRLQMRTHTNALLNLPPRFLTHLLTLALRDDTAQCRGSSMRVAALHVIKHIRGKAANYFMNYIAEKPEIADSDLDLALALFERAKILEIYMEFAKALLLKARLSQSGALQLNEKCLFSGDANGGSDWAEGHVVDTILNEQGDLMYMVHTQDKRTITVPAGSTINPDMFESSNPVAMSSDSGDANGGSDWAEGRVVDTSLIEQGDLMYMNDTQYKGTITVPAGNILIQDIIELLASQNEDTPDGSSGLHEEVHVRHVKNALNDMVDTYLSNGTIDFKPRGEPPGGGSPEPEGAPSHVPLPENYTHASRKSAVSRKGDYYRQRSKENQRLSKNMLSFKHPGKPPLSSSDSDDS